MQQRNTCVSRLLASSGPTTLSFVLTIKFKERVQGIGVAIGSVNAQLLLFPLHYELLSTKLVLVFIICSIRIKKGKTKGKKMSHLN
jgi:hypothetical protein